MRIVLKRIPFYNGKNVNIIVNSKNLFFLLLFLLINIFFRNSYEISNEAIKRASGEQYGGDYRGQVQQQVKQKLLQHVQNVQQEVLSYAKIGQNYYGPHGIAQQVQQQVNYGGK